MLPVVFLPGIFGSVPLLGGRWSFGPSALYYKPVIQAMKKAGVHVEVAFYSWWKNNLYSAQKYLVPAINRALKFGESDKVVLLCHSMGGIVARSYVQSDFYRNDVKRIIMLSTPNEGSANAYYPWEGGQVPPSPYEDFGNMLYTGFVWIISRIAGKPVTYELIREYVPSIKELLPASAYGSYLFECGRWGNIPLFIPQSGMKERNEHLNFLNDSVGIIRKRGIDVFCFNGKGYYTNKFIQVDTGFNGKDGLWADGKPMAEIRSSMGDGTVLVSSSKYEFDSMTLSTSHMGILKDGIPYVLKQLDVSKLPEIPWDKVMLKDPVAYIVDKMSSRRKLLKDCHDVLGRFEWGVVDGREEFTVDIPVSGQDMCLYAYNSIGGTQTDLKLRDSKCSLHKVLIKRQKGLKPIIEML
ncbi:esterase/lipase family protein [Caldanaerobius polysaccharolyticus]|uniref:esterase/lipase family protein n=1 Tax=Caldanaerobius polysaccharolyticus TaxID=44256 RepID=UPI00068D08E3|nr:hypothetical protein [Caldanaerobius polysaccharolyticus]